MGGTVTRATLRAARTRTALVALLVGCAIAGCSEARSDDGARRDAPTSSTVTSAAVDHVDVPAGRDATVTSVTDGDTIRVRVDGTDERVRLIGIDTPETHDPRTVVECFGREAAAHTTELLAPGTRVRLEHDVEPRDRYGRTLAYVYRADDGLFVNEELVRDGWAVPYRYPPNVRYADEISALGHDARERGVGLWGACGGADTPADASHVAATTAPRASATSNGTTASGACDPNYAGACVPVSSTDLDCSDVGAHGFRVVGTDVHRLDGNHDGIACE